MVRRDSFDLHYKTLIIGRVEVEFPEEFLDSLADACSVTVPTPFSIAVPRILATASARRDVWSEENDRALLCPGAEDHRLLNS